MGFLSIHLKGMRNDQHFQYQGDFGELVDNTGAEDLKIVPLFEDWKAGYAQENEALKKISKSPVTEAINLANAHRDNMFRGLSDTLKGMLNHYEPKKVEAAKLLQIVFTTYGNIASKPLSEKIGIYANLIEEVHADHYAAAVETCELNDWFDVLETCNDDVRVLIKQRDEENAGRSMIVLKEARRTVDLAHNAILKRITSLLDVEGSADPERKEFYEQFIRRLNAIIERHNNSISARRSHGKGAGKDNLQGI